MWDYMQVVIFLSILIYQASSLRLAATNQFQKITPSISDEFGLWNGLDGLDVRNGLDNYGYEPKRLIHDNPSNMKPSKHLFLLGAFDSGTHLAQVLLKQNFELEWEQTCEPHAFAIQPNIKAAHCGVWKHGLDGANTFFDILRHKNVMPKDALVLMLVRSPISQLVSWRNEPWELEECMLQPLGANTSCKAVLDWPKSGVKADGIREFSSAMDVYNKYLSMYQELKSRQKSFGGVALIAYEDLVLTPHETLLDIAHSFGWANPSIIKTEVMKKPAKWHSLERDAAVEKLRMRSYLSKVTSSELQNMCQGINHTLLESFQEGTHLPVPRPYLKDCELNWLDSWIDRMNKNEAHMPLAEPARSS
eukprot:gnl/MRDRNA2_/MRDRNA2_86788_c0_seq6.p1 gnl/MRDRNA2_/MRDRNA2_86788_c0~~gnl/MRDRNA2_/MRDRNA2_86788_c0_seq6.p1  ORF type:complete len:362 (+),score=53.85 gnl/MRDRNA2_/MRDRNA2_86788_c0_seq6:113-1198(+)